MEDEEWENVVDRQVSIAAQRSFGQLRNMTFNVRTIATPYLSLDTDIETTLDEMCEVLLRL